MEIFRKTALWGPDLDCLERSFSHEGASCRQNEAEVLDFPRNFSLSRTSPSNSLISHFCFKILISMLFHTAVNLSDLGFQIHARPHTHCFQSPLSTLLSKHVRFFSVFVQTEKLLRSKTFSNIHRYTYASLSISLLSISNLHNVPSVIPQFWITKHLFYIFECISWWTLSKASCYEVPMTD